MPGERQPNGQRTTDRSRRSEGRVPPHNLQAEESVLGALLLSREAIGVVSEQGLNPADFYRPGPSAHLRRDPRPVLERRPGRHGHRRRRAAPGRAARRGRWLGGDARAAERDACHLERQPLRQDRPGHGDAAPADLCRGRHRRARLQRARRRHQGPRRGRDQGVPVAEQRVTDSVRQLDHLLSEAMDRLQETFDRGDTITGVATGYTDIDELLSGLQPSSLYIVGARPAMGKCVAGTRRWSTCRRARWSPPPN